MEHGSARSCKKENPRRVGFLCGDSTSAGDCRCSLDPGRKGAFGQRGPDNRFCAWFAQHSDSESSELDVPSEHTRSFGVELPNDFLPTSSAGRFRSWHTDHDRMDSFVGSHGPNRKGFPELACAVLRQSTTRAAGAVDMSHAPRPVNGSLPYRLPQKTP